MALSPGGQTIATGNMDKTIQLIPRNFFQSKAKTLTGHQAEIWQVVFSLDGRLVGSVSSDGTAKLWTLDGKLFRTLPHTAAVWRMGFSRDSKMVVTGSGDNTAKLWTVAGKLLKTFEGHKAAVWGVAISPDGNIIASGSVDTSVKLWNKKGKELTTLTGHTASVRGVAISPYGTFLASVGDDSTLILWNLPRILNLDILTYGCQLIQNYLKTNITLEESDRSICSKN